MPNSVKPTHTPDVLTADLALVYMCQWMRGLQVDLARAVDELYAEVDEAHHDVVTINGYAFMRYKNFNQLRALRGLTLDKCHDPRFTEGVKVFEAVERGDWFEIDGIERAGVMLNGERGVDAREES